MKCTVVVVVSRGGSSRGSRLSNNELGKTRYIFADNTSLPADFYRKTFKREPAHNKSGMKVDTLIIKKLDTIEKEIKGLKMLLRKENPKKTVSLRGMGRLKVPEKELDKAIIDAKKSLFGVKDREIGAYREVETVWG